MGFWGVGLRCWQPKMLRFRGFRVFLPKNFTEKISAFLPNFLRQIVTQNFCNFCCVSRSYYVFCCGCFDFVVFCCATAFFWVVPMVLFCLFCVLRRLLRWGWCVFFRNVRRFFVLMTAAHNRAIVVVTSFGRFLPWFRCDFGVSWLCYENSALCFVLSVWE